MKWTETTLGEIGPFQYGKGLPASKRNKGNVPVYGSNGIVGTHDVPYLRQPAIIIGRKGSVGKVHFAEGDSWPIDTAFYTLGSEKVDLTFLFYLLQTIPINYNSDSAVPGLNRDYAHSLNVSVPPMDVQIAIGKVLRNLDQKIEVNRRISKDLESIGETLFKAWFVHYEPMRFDGNADNSVSALFPSSFTELEELQVPTGWQVKSLAELDLHIETGTRPKGGVSGIASGIPSIGAESINGIGVFDESKTKFVPLDFYAKMRRGIPKDFDVLLYKDGGKPGEFKPRVGMYGLGFPFDSYVVNEHVFILRSQSLGQSFLYFFISWSKTLDELRLKGIKGAIPGINQRDVLDLEVVVPGSEILEKFNKFADSITEQILTLSTESKFLKAIRESLLTRLVSGELEIPEELLGE